MKKTVLFITAVFILATSAIANPVSTTLASRVAANFWAAHRPAGMPASVTPKPLAFADLDQLHIFDMEGKGFVIVAADDRVQPILAYSFDNTFPTSLNRDIAYWLQGYNDQIATAAKNDYAQRESVLQQWEKLMSTDLTYGKSANTKSDSTTDLTAVPAMLKTRWNQSDPYNKFCPYDSLRHDRTVVGCVATAMAQIMKYWNYPTYGAGSRSYHPRSMWHPGESSPLLTADFENTTYLWPLMPNFLQSFSNSAEVDAVATLSYHCGVAVEMMYGVSADGGSGAYSSCGSWANACATSAFRDHFKYDTNLYYAERRYYNEADWCAIIDENLAQGQPMYYDGSDSTGGHAFVLDGSDTEGRYHFNWGWAGFGDGFYTINNLAPDGYGIGGNATYTFNNDQGAIFGLRPGMVETFDTVDYYDSVCSETQFTYFRDYRFLACDMDTLVPHLDTMFHYHLKIINKKRIFLYPNLDNVMPTSKHFCPATGYTFPECPFEHDSALFFLGWCRDANGDDTIYAPGQTVYPNQNISYFALWLQDVGIDEADGDNLQVSPTVTESDINLSLTGEYDATVTIVDSYGRVVIQKDIVAREAKISLSRLPAGVYNVIVTAQGSYYKTRIIKL